MVELKQRLEEELRELTERTNKLDDFISTDDRFDLLSAIQQSLLNTQLGIMDTYITCLRERIKNL